MAASNAQPSGPDFGAGVPLHDIPQDGVLAGHVGSEPVLLWRSGEQVRAVGGACTHYGGRLSDGLVVGETVRCPLHHACFSLRTGEALCAPAFDALPLWNVTVRDGVVIVGSKVPKAKAAADEAGSGNGAERIVIVGGGAAGFAAAEMLRRRGYGGQLTMLSAETAPPCDRPNLSKDYLAGTAPEEWIPLKGAGFYRTQAIDLRLDTGVVQVDAERPELVTDQGEHLAWDRLLLATGAEPVRLSAPGFDRPNVHTLRSLADAQAIIAQAEGAARVVVVGASFIALEAAAALRSRGLEVQVVGPEQVCYGASPWG